MSDTAVSRLTVEERRALELRRMAASGEVSANQLAKYHLTQMLSEPERVMARWAESTAIISMAAAADGQYDTALDGMRMVGEHMGHLRDGKDPSQHIHLDTTDRDLVREAASDVIETRLAQLKSQMAAPDPDPDEPAPYNPEEDPLAC